MFHSLVSLPKRALLDTNVLLDSAFVTDGLARRATSLLIRLEMAIIIDEITEAEAKRKLDQRRRALGLSFDPMPILTEHIRAVRALHVPAGDQLLAASVHRADRHVAAAARAYGAWVLTGDAPLIVECDKAGIPARFPWDVIMEDAQARGKFEELGNIIRCVPPRQDQGLIFARVIPGRWRGTKAPGRFTVCDIENIGCVYYDNPAQEWVFELSARAVAKAKCRLDDDRPWAVCSSYRLPPAGIGKVAIRVGRYPAAEQAATVDTLKRFSGAGPGRISIGSNVAGADSWDGHLRALVSGPHAMSKDTWKAIVATQEGAPNPYDADALDQVLSRMQALGGQPIMGTA